jgi:predicted metal-binding protein
MKKVNLKNKLSLNKETVANLNNIQMNEVNGGQVPTKTCYTYCIGCAQTGSDTSCPPSHCAVGSCVC